MQTNYELSSQSPQPPPLQSLFKQPNDVNSNVHKDVHLISYLHTKLKAIRRGVSGLETDSPCGVWGLDESLASCVVVQF